MSKLSKSGFVQVDIYGMFLLLASSVLLDFALEEGGSSTHGIVPPSLSH